MKFHSLLWLSAVLVLALTVPAKLAHAIPLKNFALEAHFDDFPVGEDGYSSCWSYIHDDGREYAVIGCLNGTAIYNVTNPAAAYFVGFIGGISSPWREMKSYRNFIYVVTEGISGALAQPEGMQIISMADPEHPVLISTYIGTFATAHTLSVDSARGLLICNGTRQSQAVNPARPATGMRILSLANPEAPVEIAAWPGGVGVPDAQYIHDCVVVGNRLYASSIFAGIERVFDFSVPENPVEIAEWTYPNAFTHNSWPDASGDVLYVTDERAREPLKVFDIRDLSLPVIVNRFTPNPDGIVHNAHVLGNELYLANYAEGIRVLDITEPRYPTEFGFADTYDGLSGGFAGVWGICPYFPSGTVIASDMKSGLWVFRPMRNYGILHIQVRDGATRAPIAGMHVTIDGAPEPMVTDDRGVIRIAPLPGTHEIVVDDFLHYPYRNTLALAAGDRDTLNLDLNLRPTVTISGVVRNEATGAALADVEVEIENTPTHQHTDAGGRYQCTIPEGAYLVHIERPGFAPRLISRFYAVGESPIQQDVTLAPARFYDAFESANNWTVGGSSNETTAGAWVRAVPIGTSTTPLPPPTGEVLAASPSTGPDARISHEGGEGEGAAAGPVQPGSDHSPPPGQRCFFTGQPTGGLDPALSDVDGGVTTLTSATLDASGLVNATVGYWGWFYGQEQSDWLAVSISNDDGATWASVDTVRGIHATWEERSIRIADYVAPTNRMKLRFKAADLGANTLVEAAIDDIMIYDGGSIPLDAGPSPAVTRFSFRAPSPNPATSAVRLVLDLPSPRVVDIEILDVMGREVRTLHRGMATSTLSLTWDGRDTGGGQAPAGLYFVRARSGGAIAEARIVRVH